jgi:ABC-2 type transport system permease protein
MLPRISTWWTILRIALQERLVYRGDFALGTLMRFLPILTQIFLWHAIFSNLAPGARITGYTYEELVVYLLLTMVSRAFSSMPGLASTIARQIRTGDIKKYLTQPVDLLSFMFLSRVAHKVAYYIVAIGPFALVFFLCRGYFTYIPDLTTAAAFAASLVLSFLLGFYLEACIGMVGFWFLEVTSLLFVYMLFSFFLSGHMFPLDMLPQPWGEIVQYTPLQYLAFFPAQVFLGKIQGWDLARGLLVEFAWVVFFIALSRFLFLRGLKRYSGYGG